MKIRITWDYVQDHVQEFLPQKDFFAMYFFCNLIFKVNLGDHIGEGDIDIIEVDSF